jgi:Ca2+-binding RTX toxin-like protein
MSVRGAGGGTDGPDLLLGGRAAEEVTALDGDDTVNGRGGNDTIDVGDGDDRANGAGGHDLIFLGDGRDRGWGGYGNDSVFGGSGNDMLQGGPGNDSMDGGGDKDILLGGDGRDTLSGGTGRDRLEGGPGEDWFLFGSFGQAHRDIVTDFVPGEDAIAISAAAFGGGLVAGMDLAVTGRFRAALTGRSDSPAGVGQLVFETDASRLWWDADGAGGPSQLVAIFSPTLGAPLTAADIIVVT